VLDIIGKVHGAGQPYVLFFSGSFIGGSHVCIVLLFVDIPALRISSLPPLYSLTPSQERTFSVYGQHIVVVIKFVL
jgi:hypothetical protein